MNITMRKKNRSACGKWHRTGAGAIRGSLPTNGKTNEKTVERHPQMPSAVEQQIVCGSKRSNNGTGSACGGWHRTGAGAIRGSLPTNGKTNEKTVGRHPQMPPAAEQPIVCGSKRSNNGTGFACGGWHRTGAGAIRGSLPTNGKTNGKTVGRHPQMPPAAEQPIVCGSKRSNNGTGSACGGWHRTGAGAIRRSLPTA